MYGAMFGESVVDRQECGRTLLGDDFFDRRGRHLPVFEVTAHADVVAPFAFALFDYLDDIGGSTRIE